MQLGAESGKYYRKGFGDLSLHGMERNFAREYDWGEQGRAGRGGAASKIDMIFVYFGIDYANYRRR